MAIQTFLLAGVTSYADPGDWSNTNNMVQAIGPGGSGSIQRTTARGGFGGGGGAQAGVAGVTPTFPVSTTVPAGTSQTKTSFGTYVIADFGKLGTTTAGGLGGSTAGSTGTASYLFAGGAATYAGTGSVGGGGAGAAGPHGAGQASSTTSGSAGNGTTSPNPTASVAAGVAGAAGTQWDASHGTGSGAGGSTVASSVGVGLVGGAFGGGGSGAHAKYTGGLTAAGGDGLIAITREFSSSRNYKVNSRFLGAGVGVFPSESAARITGTLVTADLTAIGTDANGNPFITIRIHGGGGTSTNVNIDFWVTNQITVLASVPYVASYYWRLAAGAMTNISSVNLQSNFATSLGAFTGQINVVATNPTSTIARVTGTTIVPATTDHGSFTLLFGYTAGAAIDATIEFSAPQYELGDVASTTQLTPEQPHSFTQQYQPILAQ